MRLFHFSDEPGIRRFGPRPVRVPSARPAGRNWLNGPLVWAIDEAHDFLYLFPRDCPRILVWAKPESSEADRQRWLAGRRAMAFVETSWSPALQVGAIHRYELPPEGFESLDDAGMWVARHPVVPLGYQRLGDLSAELAARDVEVRIVESLAPLKPLWQSSLHVSGLRLGNATGWC